jgi:CrcB protein
MQRFLLICLAGALGTGVRYLVAMWAGRALGTAFPFGTLIVNVVGCFLMAIVMHVALETTYVSATARLTLSAGFLGGLTTYSSFNYETSKFIQERAWGPGLLNFAGTTVICFVAGLLGLLTAKTLLASGN